MTGKKIYEKLLSELNEGCLLNFTLEGYGSSKIVFSFHDKENRYVIKVNTKVLNQKQIDFIHKLYRQKIIYDIDVSGNQTLKEIILYKKISREGSYIKNLFLPTLIKISDNIKGEYSIQPYAQKCQQGYYEQLSKEKLSCVIQNIKKHPMLNKNIDNHILNKILTNFFPNKRNINSLIKEINQIFKAKNIVNDKFGINIFDDLTKDNLGIYKNRVVLLDYGYY